MVVMQAPVLHHESHGRGGTILCIHGTGGSARLWGDAITALARIGRVIAYDRRGCDRSATPASFARTSVHEQAGDAAQLLRDLDAAPAVVVGRSYGGTVALDLAIHHPSLVRALVVLEGDAPRELAPRTARWVDALGARLRAIADQRGVSAVGEALITDVAGSAAWRAWPEEVRQIVTANGPAILAELAGEWWLEADAEALARVTVPVLLVTAADSPPELREPAAALAVALPNARTAAVEGGHVIDPAHPAVLEFVRGALD
jgi:pimeloyl-ACP methyl ester carboxylesterase